jgi:ABC-type transport system involved in multi-copper enzyme maturation permease subunit
MRIRLLAWITFLALLRNRLIILFFAIFVCVILLMMTPLLTMRSMAADNQSQAMGMETGLITVIMSMVSGFGSLLAAWSAADAVASEMKNGTILAVMARPVRRWEFLLSKYCGVLLLMAVYVVFMFAVSNVLAWIGGERLVTNPWVLLVYPMVRYGIYAAVAIWLVTVMHPVFAFVIVLIGGVIANLVAPSSMTMGMASVPLWLRNGLFYALPSMNLLSETNFLAISSASLKPTPWTQHLIALVYGLDWSLVCLMLAAWAFRHRSLSRE